MYSLLLCLICLALPLFGNANGIKTSKIGKYQPTWESLDARPLPTWYDEAKIGIFLHWGVFASPAFGSEWFWWYLNGEKIQKYVDFMSKNHKPVTTYQDLAKDFTAEFYNPDTWADIFNASGARYVVLTTKHHEGFTLWPSESDFSWNAMDVGPKLDLVGALATAVRRHPNLRFGIYHSLFEWFNPIYLKDKENNYTTQDFALRKSMPELYDLVKRYKPDVIWSDGDGGVPSSYWQSKEFLAWLYNDSPVKDTVVTNDRWGAETSCKHGGYYSCNDRYNPGVLQPHKWENAMTIDKGSWGYRRDAALDDHLTIEDLIDTLVGTVSCGGNLLVNVGPTKDGRIEPLFEERLKQMGSWLAVNGEAIYASVPWTSQNDSLTPGIWYTSKINKTGMQFNDVTEDVSVYAILLNWPKGSIVTLGSVTDAPTSTAVTMLGSYKKPILWKNNTKGEMVVSLPYLTPDELPCQWAWVLKIAS